MTTSFSEILQNAWERRAPLRARTQAFRLLNGAASGTPGLVVDMFSDFLAVYVYATDLTVRYGDWPTVLREVTGAAGASLKDRANPDESGRDTGGDLFGILPETVEVSEGPGPGTQAPALRFQIHLRHPRNVGLFLDTRPLRENLLRASRGAEVLNLFSYSCSLGAAAAAGGAAAVANVDISARYLGWGKDNFRLSGLPEEGMKFIRMDGEAYLDWAARKDRSFDTIVLDPPSFARADGKTFAFEKDYFRLLAKAASRLRPGGRIFAVTNYGGITAARFRESVSEAMASAGKAPEGLRAIGLPEDFDPSPDGLARRESREGAFLALEAKIPPL